jgi:RHS repeat-associated protein
MNTRQDGNTVSNDILFYPWGQVWASPGNDYLEFFGSIPNWDWEISQGVTPNRYYPNTQGRWLSPDPLAGDISNPQSLNRYAYVLNNPTTLTDPTGLQGGCFMSQATGGCVPPGQAYQGAPPWIRLGLGPISAGWSDSLYLLSLSTGSSSSSTTTTYQYDLVTVNGTQVAETMNGVTYDDLLWAPGTTYWIPTGVVYGTTDSGSGGILSVWIPGFAPRGNRTSQAAKSGNSVETLAKGLNALTTPLQNVAVSGGLFLTGTAVLAISVGSSAAVCAGTALVGCGAFVVFGGVPTFGGGVALIYTGYQYTKQITIPSFENFGH